MKTINSIPEAIQILKYELLTLRLNKGLPVTVLTGAGISTDSGIPDYRGPNGTYVKFKDYRPIRFQDFMSSEISRKRYWARSVIGFKEMSKASPNSSHFALSKLKLPIITQNVDSLHQQAGTLKCLELHGSLRQVICMSCRRKYSREWFQQELVNLNQHMLVESRQWTIRPDGDVDLGSFDYSKFLYPTCSCSELSIIKPDVVFFGENVEPRTKHESFEMVRRGSLLLVVGSSLEVYSAFRLIKEALGNKTPVILLTLGRTRADELGFSLIQKLEVPCGKVLPELLAY
jgi:NAD+-dependent protein deacetylase sirtuin 4